MKKASNLPIRPEVMKVVGEIRKQIKTERLQAALEYNEAIRNAWSEIWTRNPFKNSRRIHELFDKYTADMAFIERTDMDRYWEAVGVTEKDLLLDSRNIQIYKQFGLSPEDTKNILEKWDNLETLNDERLKKALPPIKQLASQLKKMTPAILIGSGASLDKIGPYLKNWKGGIFCSSSHLHWLEYYGVKPTFVTIIDSDPTMGYLIDDYDSSDIPLITHPCIDNYIIENWKGPVYFFRMNDPGDPWFGNYLPKMINIINEEKKTGIHSHVLNSGCVVNVNIAIAQFLGYFPIYLMGVDWTVGRFTDHRKDKEGKWTTIEPPMPNAHAYLSMGNTGQITSKVSVFYKYSQMVIYGLDGPQLISCSSGLNTELPYADPLEVIAKQGRGFESIYRTPQECYKVAFEYLFPRGVYIMKTPSKVQIMNKDSLKTLKQKIGFWKEYLNGKRHGWW